MSSNNDSSYLDLVGTLHSGKRLRLTIEGTKDSIKSKIKDSLNKSIIISILSAIWNEFKDEFSKSDEVVLSPMNNTYTN